MAKYQIFGPAFVNNTYFPASPQSPEIIVIPNDCEPSRKWTPLDEPAAEAMAKLLGTEVSAVEAVEKDEAPPEEPKTLAEAAKAKKAK